MRAPAPNRRFRALAVAAGFAMAGFAMPGSVGHADAAIISKQLLTDFSSLPAVIHIGPANYTFSAIPGALPGDPPDAVATGGTAQVSSLGGGVADFGIGATIDGTGEIYSFSGFPSPAVIPYSAADDFIGLAFTLSDGLHYGYAEVAGTELVGFGFETVPGAGIVTGAMPEPTTIAVLGVGLAGLASARRRRRRVCAAGKS